jgi:hypothetical protein
MQLQSTGCRLFAKDAEGKFKKKATRIPRENSNAIEKKYYWESWL